MKFLFLLFSLLAFSGCGNQAAFRNESSLPQPSPTPVLAGNSNQSKPLYENYQVDQAKLQELRAQNQQFRQTPVEFKGVDFKNFKYSTKSMKGFIKLKNGEFEYENFKECDNHFGSLNDVFYVDLKGSESKQAIVFLTDVACGCGSCDGGRQNIYLYSAQNGKAKLLDKIETGANAGGCSLKSFTIKDRKIIVEQFGRCSDGSVSSNNKEFTCKFCVKDETRTIYSLKEDKLKKELTEITETGQINVMNVPALISIN